MRGIFRVLGLLSDLQQHHTSVERMNRATVFHKQSAIFVSWLSPCNLPPNWGRTARNRSHHVKIQPSLLLGLLVMSTAALFGWLLCSPLVFRFWVKVRTGSSILVFPAQYTRKNDRKWGVKSLRLNDEIIYCKELTVQPLGYIVLAPSADC